MSDYRDPNYRDPMRDPSLDMESGGWSAATWGWIAGIAVVVLVLIFAATGGDNRTASDSKSSPPATTGQRTNPSPPVGGAKSDAPTTNPSPNTTPDSTAR
jgi:hypothetical protein